MPVENLPGERIESLVDELEASSRKRVLRSAKAPSKRLSRPMSSSTSSMRFA